MATLWRTCATVPQPSELRFGVVRAVGGCIAVLDGGPRRARGRGGFGVFVHHFHNGKCHWVADGELFPIRMRKLDISVRQMYRWKARFVGFLRYSHFRDRNCGLWEITKKVTIAQRHNERTQQACGRNMHIHEWPPRRTAHRARPELRLGYACWPQPAPWEILAATRPCSQITLADLLVVVVLSRKFYSLVIN